MDRKRARLDCFEGYVLVVEGIERGLDTGTCTVSIRSGVRVLEWKYVLKIWIPNIPLKNSTYTRFVLRSICISFISRLAAH